jgi:hypothetical protein
MLKDIMVELIFESRVAAGRFLQEKNKLTSAMIAVSASELLLDVQVRPDAVGLSVGLAQESAHRW